MAPATHRDHGRPHDPTAPRFTLDSQSRHNPRMTPERKFIVKTIVATISTSVLVLLALAWVYFDAIDRHVNDTQTVTTSVNSPIPWQTVCDPARDYQEDDGCWDAELHGDSVIGPLWNCETMGDRSCERPAPVPVPVEREGNR